MFPFEKLYKVISKKVDSCCISPAHLNANSILDFDTLISTAEKIDQETYDKANKKETVAKTVEEPKALEPHVVLANSVMDIIPIKFFKESFYLYENRSL